MHKCHEVTEKIMSCFALGLGLEEDFFKEVSSCHTCWVFSDCIPAPHLLLHTCILQWQPALLH